MDWLGRTDVVAVIAPQYTRTKHETWIYFEQPAGLIYKCSHGRVDLAVKHLGVADPGVEEIQARVVHTLPDRAVVTSDDSGNTVVRTECPKVSPQHGPPRAETEQCAAVEDGLDACVSIAVWLDQGGRAALTRR